MGIFDTANLFTTYQARLKFRDKLMGGTPRDPKLIEGWLRAKAGITDTEEVRQAMLRTLLESGADVTPDMDYAQLAAASEKVAGTLQTTGFKRNADGLYVEARQMKALLKEAINILYPYQAEGGKGKWGATKKAARSFAAERVFVEPQVILLGRAEPDGVEMFIGHVSGVGGARSTLTYYEYVAEAEISFQVRVAEDAVPHEAWPRIWTLAEYNGFGALRSQGFGTFDVLQWEPVTAAAARELVTA